MEALTAFLSEVDFTLSGLDAPSVRLWIERDESGAIVGSTGYEISGDGHHALIRSVAVSPTQRSRGRGSALASFALERAAEEGAMRAWLFSGAASGEGEERLVVAFALADLAVVGGAGLGVAERGERGEKHRVLEDLVATT